MNSEEVRTVLAERAGAIDATRPERVEELFGRIRRHKRQRTAAAVAGATCLALALGAGVALLASGTRDAAPPPAGPDHKTHAPDNVQTRPAQRKLTYSVGSTIHWGDRTIDVGRQANRWPHWGKLVDFVDATDDGAVFVIGQPPFEHAGVETIPFGPAAVWFTAGSAPVRIGTTIGDRPRGFVIAASTTEGSTLAWTDPGSRAQPGQIVVYDTARMSEVGRFGNADAQPLAVYPDVVYWLPAGGCSSNPSGWWRPVCQGSGPVMRFDVASREQVRVSRADYLADRRVRPGLFVQPEDHGRASAFLGLVRRGDRLLAEGEHPDTLSTPSLATTGQSLLLRMPASDRDRNAFTVTQWLDPDRVVLVDTDTRGDDLVTCRLSTGRCELAVRIPHTGAAFTPPGPAVSHG